MYKIKIWSRKDLHLYCSVFNELGADRKLRPGTIDRRQTRLKRSNIRWFHSNMLITSFCFVMVLYHHCTSYWAREICVCHEVGRLASQLDAIDQEVNLMQASRRGSQDQLQTNHLKKRIQSSVDGVLDIVLRVIATFRLPITTKPCSSCPAGRTCVTLHVTLCHAIPDERPMVEISW